MEKKRIMKRSESEKMMLEKQRKKSDYKKKKFLITVNFLGSAGPIRFIVNEDNLIADVIATSLKIYSAEGRLPVLASTDPNDFFLYCPNSGPDALNPCDPIGSRGERNFVVCKKQKQPQMTEARQEMITRKKSGWKSWLNKSFSFNKILSY